LCSELTTVKIKMRVLRNWIEEEGLPVLREARLKAIATRCNDSESVLMRRVLIIWVEK